MKDCKVGNSNPTTYGTILPNFSRAPRLQALLIQQDLNLWDLYKASKMYEWLNISDTKLAPAINTNLMAFRKQLNSITNFTSIFKGNPTFTPLRAFELSIL